MRTRYLCALATALLLAPAALAQGLADEAKAHLQHNAARYGATTADLSDLAVTDAYRSRRSGTTHVYLRQAHGGLPIVGAEFTVAVNRDGEVFHAVGRGVTLAGRDLATAPSVGAERAAQALALDAGLTPTAFRVLSSEGTATAPSLKLSEGGVAQEPVVARLVYYRDADTDGVSLAWEVGMYEIGSQHYWLGYVDATSGRVLARQDLVVHDTFGPASAGAASAEAASFAPTAPADAPSVFAPAAVTGSYKVYGYPVESPYYSNPPTPADGRTLEVDPDHPTASPFGWHDTDGDADPDFTITRGNNVHAYTDTNNNDQPDPGSEPDGGAALVFDNPINLTAAPSTYRPASVTNLFYWNNIIHDVFYLAGFDEAAGNFQVNNYGNGGLGNDDVRAEAQDGGGTNNANMFTPVDGQRPRMQMYIGTNANPDTDGDLDNLVIMHEYGHGISNRLVGGPQNVSCLDQSEQPGEGISDYYGLMVTVEGNGDGDDPRGVGTYLFGQGPEAPGIRDAPYSTDFAVNDFTYQDTRTRIVPHGVGFVFATIWWEVTRDMIDAHGYDADIWDPNGTAGNQVMIQLLTEAMKLVPCEPGFVDMRDAMFAADEALYGGDYCDTMWPGFARRGLGIDAVQGSSNRNSDNTDGFTPGTCGGGGGDVAVTVTPTGPTTIPSGDRLHYDVTVDVPADGPTSLNVWQEMTTPTGDTRPFRLNTIMVTPGTSTTFSLQVRLRSTFPPGSYALAVSVGTFPDAVLDSDGFGFEVVSLTGVPSDARAMQAAGSDEWLVYDAAGRLIEDGAVLDLRTASDAASAAASTAGLPSEPALHAAYPNPFSGSATLRYDVAAVGAVRVAVYDLLGREVAVLADGAHGTGRFSVALDGRDLPSGVYLVRMTADGFTQTQRVTVMK